jgi:hypothetical protein
MEWRFKDERYWARIGGSNGTLGNRCEIGSRATPSEQPPAPPLRPFPGIVIARYVTGLMGQPPDRRIYDGVGVLYLDWRGSRIRLDVFCGALRVVLCRKGLTSCGHNLTVARDQVPILFAGRVLLNLEFHSIVSVGVL